MHAVNHSQAENWSTFNDLAKRTLEYDPLVKEDLTRTFLQIEQLIFKGVDYLLMATTFVEDNLCYLLAEIASGVIKSRKVYKGKRVRRRVAMNDEIEMGAENKRIFGIGFDLFKLSRMDRQHAVPFSKRIIRTLRISTSHYENILTAFAKVGARYIEVSDDLAHTTLRLINQRQKNEKRATKKGAASETALTKQAEEFIDQMDLLELDMGCVEPNLLYGTIRAVVRILKRVRVLQERILKAYSRLVLKPVKGRAQTEMEALDLFQSGSLGLSRAISLYDLRCGTSFPTFANWWIRQKILGSAKHSGSLIKLPGSVIERYQEITKAERFFESNPDLRDSYTIEDVAARCKTTAKSVELVLRKVRSTRVVSLESMVSSNEEGYESDLAADRALLDESMEEEEALQATSEFVSQVLSHVEESQRNLVCLRYGIIERVVSKLDPRQEVRELFRQAACKALLQQKMSMRANSHLAMLRVEELPADQK